MLSESILTRLQFQHEAIMEIVSGVSQTQLETSPIPGKWSAMENIAHLASYQKSFLLRIELVRTKVLPFLNRYVAEQDPDFTLSRKQNLADLWHSLTSTRKEIIDLLTGLPSAEMKRAGIHPVAGKLNVMELTEFFLLHEAHHMMTIFKIVHVNP